MSGNKKQDAGDNGGQMVIAPNWSSADTLAAKVPVASEVTAENSPTILWLVKSGKIGAIVFLNGILPADQAANYENDPTIQQFLDFEERLNTVTKYTRATTTSDTVGEDQMDLTSAPKKAESFADLAKEIQVFLKNLQEQSKQAQAAAPPPPASEPPATSFDDYTNLFRIIPLPEFATTFQRDEVFSKFRVAGPNPMSLKEVTRSELEVLVGCRITDKNLNETLGTNGDSLERAGREGRLCVVNYSVMAVQDPVVVVGKSFVTDPIAVFCEPINGETIKPVAIQLGQDPVISEMIFANSEDYYRWQMAKYTVQVADGLYHEVVSHLAHTHLVAEAFCISTQKNLATEHPIRRLLMPHFEGTNFINEGAAANLIAPGGSIAQVFCNNSESRLKSIQTIAVGGRFEFDFSNRMPDVELKSRNVDKLKVFPYRDDALMVWEAILHWAKDYVNLYYGSDDDVDNDEELMKWAYDILINGDLKNFRLPRTKERLIRTLAMIMFICSAQHAAVNFTQVDFMGYAPAMTGAVWDDFPPPDQKATEADFIKLMPPLSKARMQMNMMYTIGYLQYGRLGDYRSNVFPYWGTLEKKAEIILTKFRDSLKAVEQIIQRRNEQRGEFAYKFLLPSNIPASINV